MVKVTHVETAWLSGFSPISLSHLNILITLVLEQPCYSTVIPRCVGEIVLQPSQVNHLQGLQDCVRWKHLPLVDQLFNVASCGHTAPVAKLGEKSLGHKNATRIAKRAHINPKGSGKALIGWIVAGKGVVGGWQGSTPK